MATEASEQIQVVVDDRERPSGVVAELRRVEGIGPKIAAAIDAVIS